MAAWVAALLTALICLGLGALAWSMWAPIGSAATSNVNTAGSFSGNRFGPNAEVALIALATRYAETPAMSPEPGPLAVWLADAPTPSPAPLLPAEATAAAQLAVIAHQRATATAEARPQDCNTSPDERVCFWPTPIPVVPTATPMPICGTPDPGQRCFKS